MEETNKRKQFIERLGLNHDPFETPVAEQELTRVQNIFYSYFSSPPLSPSHEELIKLLRRPQQSFIFGLPGNGKSTVRLNLEADCRTVLDNTLAITYILGEDVERPPSQEEHGARLAKALSIDFTLAIIEQFNPIPHFPSEKKLEALRGQVRIGGRQLKRLLRILLEKLKKSDPPVLDPIWGISKDWTVIGKAPVKYIGGSKELESLLEELLIPSKEKKTANWSAFWQGIEVAQKWGFKRFFVLIDGVDTKQRSPQAMLDLITPLLDAIPAMEAKNISIKFFLPLELEESIQAHLRSHDWGLPSRAFFSIMEWDDTGLRQLLAQRFRAAMSRSGPYYQGLNSLATPNMNLDENVIRAAEGSPRRLLKVISDLIDVHLARDPDSLQFNQKDWEIYRQKYKINMPG